MLRISGATKENAPEEVRNLFEEQEKQYGALQMRFSFKYPLKPDDL